MAKQAISKKIKSNIEKISQLYAGISFYYADFLSIQETHYNFQQGLSKNTYEQMRVIDRNTLGIYQSNVPIESYEQALKQTALNARVASVFKQKTTRVYYPYIHRYHKSLQLLNAKQIKQLKHKINQYKRRYSIHSIDVHFTQRNKQFVSSAGSSIEQGSLLVHYDIQTQKQHIKDSIRLYRLKDFKLPAPSHSIHELKKRYPLFLSPKLVAQLAQFLFDKNITIPQLQFSVAPYLYKGLQSGLYDDEGTIRFKAPYHDLTGGNLFQKDNTCAYTYDFKTQSFMLTQPDLNLPKGKTYMKDIIKHFDDNRYLLADSCEKIEYNQGIFILHADLFLHGKEGNLGHIKKKLVLSLGEFKNIKNIMADTATNAFNQSSISAPYVFVNLKYGTV